MPQAIWSSHRLRLLKNDTGPFHTIQTTFINTLSFSLTEPELSSNDKYNNKNRASMWSALSLNLLAVGLSLIRSLSLLNTNGQYRNKSKNFKTISRFHYTIVYLKKNPTPGKNVRSAETPVRWVIIPEKVEKKNIGKI